MQRSSLWAVRAVKFLKNVGIAYQSALAKAGEVASEVLGNMRTVAAFGITPRSADAILPSYLWRYRPAGQFTRKGAA